MLKVVLPIVFLAFIGCGSNSSSSGGTTTNPLIATQAQCLSINQLTATSPDFLFELSDQTVYQIDYRSIIILSEPGVTGVPGTIVTGVISWGQCQIFANQGTVVSATWN